VSDRSRVAILSESHVQQGYVVEEDAILEILEVDFGLWGRQVKWLDSESCIQKQNTHLLVGAARRSSQEAWLGDQTNVVSIIAKHDSLCMKTFNEATHVKPQTEEENEKWC